MRETTLATKEDWRAVGELVATGALDAEWAGEDGVCEGTRASE